MGNCLKRKTKPIYETEMNKNETIKETDRKYLTRTPEDFKERISEALKEKKTPAILLNTGSFCPVHRDHVEFMLSNKRFLENNFNIKVICCYLSPSHDVYVSSKMDHANAMPFFIDFSTRCELIESLLKDMKAEKDIFVDKWEGSQPDFVDFPTVWTEMHIYFNNLVAEQGLSPSIKVFYSVGSDMLKTSIDMGHKCLNRKKNTYCMPLIVCDRPNANCQRAENKMIKYRGMTKEEMEKEDLFINKENCQGLSSSLMRKILEKKSEQSLDFFLDGESQKILEKYLKEIEENRSNASVSKEIGKFTNNLVAEFPRLNLTRIPKDFEERISKALKENKTPAILLNTGSYCPVHRNHVEFMLENKRFLEKNFDLKVICCYLSPSHDDYVFSKINSANATAYFIDFPTRCKLIESLLKSMRADDDIFVDLWEGSQLGFVHGPIVWEKMQIFFSEFVSKQGNSAPFVKVFLSVGSDKLRSGVDINYKKVRINDGFCSLPLVVCDRPNANCERAEKKMVNYRKMDHEEMKKENLFINKEPSTLNLSSSMLRDILEKKSDQSLDLFLDEDSQKILITYLSNKNKTIVN